jgi:hypothetical protein
MNNGTLMNGAGFVPGVAGQAFSFDGSGAYVEVPDSAGLRITGTVSASFWAKRQRLGTDMVIEKGGDWNIGQTNYGAGLHTLNNNTFFFIAKGGWWGADGVADLGWHHYAFVAMHGDSAPALYIDGVARAVTSHGGAATIDLYPSTRPLHIGSQIEPNGYPGFGTYYGANILDEVQVFNRALSASEIAAMHSAGAACAGSSAGTVVPGFNLAGNGVNATLNVLATFGSADPGAAVAGITDKVEAVWAWNASTRKWKFHTPQFTVANSTAYALANNYEALDSVPPGAGYWIGATVPFNLPPQAGTAFNHDIGTFGALPPSFNLLSAGRTLTVQQFNAGVGTAPVSFNALWAWDASRAKWYFYSPVLEQPGAPFTNCEYCNANGYQDFGGCTPTVPALSLQPGFGFWVEKN